MKLETGVCSFNKNDIFAVNFKNFTKYCVNLHKHRSYTRYLNGLLKLVKTFAET